MKIKKLLKKVELNPYIVINNHRINSLKINSKEVIENDVFFAIKGHKETGIDYITEAIKNGAKTIVYEEDFVKESHNINYIKVVNIKTFLALCANFFYHNISKKVKIIAVTGTNGKTTISTLLTDFLSYLGEEILLIGTNGIYVKEEHFHSNNTTPNIIEIYDAIYYSYKKGVKTVIIEASSIGIREARLLFLDIDVVVFSNLGHDHFDYHKNITDYRFSKGLLMWLLPFKKDKCVVLNKDDENYSFYCSLTKSKIFSYSIEKNSMYQAFDIKKSFYESNFKINIRNNQYFMKTSLVGGFNIYNILATLTTIDFLKKSIIEFQDFLKIYISVNGRMNKIFYKNKTIIIDFAHTPNSVLNVLTNIKQFTNNKLCVVVGCGGNRDIEKRSEIGLISSNISDRVIFTTDNPRDENPEKIINDMVSKLEKNNYEIIYDRKQAIINALENNNKDEVIIILGKGSERSQIINGIKFPFIDKEVVYNWIKFQKK